MNIESESRLTWLQVRLINIYKVLLQDIPTAHLSYGPLYRYILNCVYAYVECFNSPHAAKIAVQAPESANRMVRVSAYPEPEGSHVCLPDPSYAFPLFIPHKCRCGPLLLAPSNKYKEQNGAK